MTFLFLVFFTENNLIVFLLSTTSKMGAASSCCRKDNNISSEYLSTPEYIQVGIKTSDTSIPMDGFTDEPLLPLEEALKPFNGKINQLSKFIKEAKTKCHYPSEHNLTLDESAAIYIYTMKWNKCLYDHLHSALNSNNRLTLQPWFKYLKLLKTALNKLPIAKSEIWQGAPFDEQIKEQLNSKLPVLYTTLCSCSPSVNDVTSYLQKTNAKNIILVGYQSINGKVITGYTANNFPEAIIWPGIKLEVLKSLVTNNYFIWTLHPENEIGKH